MVVTWAELMAGLLGVRRVEVTAARSAELTAARTDERTAELTVAKMVAERVVLLERRSVDWKVYSTAAEMVLLTVARKVAFWVGNWVDSTAGLVGVLVVHSLKELGFQTLRRSQYADNCCLTHSLSQACQGESCLFSSRYGQRTYL